MIGKRYIVPIAAMFNAGKSNLSNVFNDISKAGIGTNFVNILRHNPKINQNKFYHLVVKKEKDGNVIKVFYKEPNYEEKIGSISIIEENKNINNFLASNTKK